MSLNKNNSNKDLPHQEPVFYQVNDSKKSLGKIHSKSKRHIIWKFGIANQKALSMGKFGFECRGQEYEIQLIWSIASGKQRIIVNNQDIYYCDHTKKKHTQERISKSWKMKLDSDEDNIHTQHVFRIVADAHRPMYQKKDIKGYHQFNLFINGCSFFDLPNIFELGMVDDKTHHNSTAYKMTKLLLSSNVGNGLRTRSFEKKYYESNDVITNFNVTAQNTAGKHNKYDLSPIQAEDNSKLESMQQPVSPPSSSVAIVDDLLDFSLEATSPTSSAVDLFSSTLITSTNSNISIVQNTTSIIPIASGPTSSAVKFPSIPIGDESTINSIFSGQSSDDETITTNNSSINKDIESAIDLFSSISTNNSSTSKNIFSEKSNDEVLITANNSTTKIILSRNSNKSSMKSDNSIVASNTVGSYDLEERQQNQNDHAVAAIKRNPFDDVIIKDEEFFNSLLNVTPL